MTPRTLLAATMIVASLLSAPAAVAQATQSDRFAAQSAMMSAGRSATQIAKIDDVPSVGVIYLPNRFARYGEEITQYRISAQKNAAGINKLRRALKANPVTRAELAGRGVKVNQIVGVKISANGSLRLYLLR